MSDFDFWNTDWAKLQQQYWEQLNELSQQAMGAKKPSRSPWEQALDQWWQSTAPDTPDLAQQFMERMIDQGKDLFRMAEEFSGSLNDAGQGDWLEQLNQTFAEMRNAFGQAAGKGAEESGHRVMAFWELPFDNWQRMLSSLSMLPGDFLRDLPNTADPEANLKQFLSAPGLGYSREQQAQQQRLTQKLVEYQEALREYSQFFAEVGLAATEKMHQRVLEMEDRQQSVESARQLYDLWVDTCETVYGERVSTEEYARLNGRLVNALMAVKRESGKLVDENLSAMNMPTRQDIRTLQHRLQETRRENKALRAELEGLKQRVEQLEARPPARPRTSSKKTVAKKRATAKRAAPRKKAASGKKAVAKKPAR